MNKIDELLEKLEYEKSSAKRWMISNLICIYYARLDEKEKIKYYKKLFGKKANSRLILDSGYYDLLISNFDIHLNITSKIYDVYKELGYYNDTFASLYPKNKVSSKKEEEILLEFLNSVDSASGAIYNNLKNSNNIILTENFKPEDSEYESEYLGTCINGLGIEPDKISLENGNSPSVTYLQTLVHEIGHSYENEFMRSMSSNQQMFRYYYSFSEVMSEFFERIFIDFLIENRIFYDDAERSLYLKNEDIFCNLMHLNFVVFACINGSCIFDDQYYQIIDYDCYKEYNKGREFAFEFEDVENYLNLIHYGYGSLIAEYFFKIYKQDKKEGLKEIKNFLSNQALISDRQMFEDIGFLDNDFSFFKENIKPNKDYLTKKYIR